MDRNETQATAWRLEGDLLVRGTPESFFPFLDGGRHVVSLVGGGGKTTTMEYLARCCRLRGMKTAVLTTTRILCPEDYCRGMEACLRRWETGAYAVCGERQADGKLAAPDPAFLAQLLEQADMVLIEADGARRLPCKAPAAHEPVILPQTDAVIAVMGLDALGGRIDEVCLRSEAVQAILGCGGGHRLTCADMAALLLSEQGSRKAVGDRDFFVVLNKCDDEARREDGKRILSLLHAQGQTQALLAAGMGART